MPNGDLFVTSRYSRPLEVTPAGDVDWGFVATCPPPSPTTPTFPPLTPAADGRLVMPTWTDADTEGLERQNPDGSLDPTFADGGVREPGLTGDVVVAPLSGGASAVACGRRRRPGRPAGAGRRSDPARAAVVKEFTGEEVDEGNANHVVNATFAPRQGVAERRQPARPLDLRRRRHAGRRLPGRGHHRDDPGRPGPRQCAGDRARRHRQGGRRGDRARGRRHQHGAPAARRRDTGGGLAWTTTTTAPRSRTPTATATPTPIPQPVHRSPQRAPVAAPAPTLSETSAQLAQGLQTLKLPALKARQGKR